MTLYNKKPAFTLAEVLITLGIISVVAALTLPSLISKYQKQITVSKLQKNYNILSNAMERSLQDNGDIVTWNIDYSGTQIKQSENFANEYIVPYLAIIKNCGSINTGDCKIESKTHGSYFNNAATRFFLNDGTLIAVLLKSTSSDGPYFTFFIDINGLKKPNESGKDQFYYQSFINYPYKKYGNGRLISTCQLVNISRSGLIKNCDGTYSDQCCSNLIMYDGWAIKDDYPW